MEAIMNEDDKEVKQVTDLKNNFERRKIKKMPSEKRKPHTIHFVTESPASRSSEKTQATISNSNNEQDPTFVCSNLLFYMSQLP